MPLLSLAFKHPTLRGLYLKVEERKYPRELRLTADLEYKDCVLNLGGNRKLEDVPCTIYVLNSRGNMYLERATGGVSHIDVGVEIEERRLICPTPLLTIASKPLTRWEIHEMDEALGPGDVKVSWSVSALALLHVEEEVEELKPESFNVAWLRVASDRFYEIPRKDFVRKVLEPADMLRREFIEVVVEPVSLEHVADPSIKAALQLIAQKQKLLVQTLDLLTRAASASEYRGVIDEVRRAVENLKDLRNIVGKAYETLGYIEAINPQIIKQASIEAADAVVEIINGIFHYSSRLGIHATTQHPKRPYIPRPYRVDAEFAIQQALITLNYLAKLLNKYAYRKC